MFDPAPFYDVRWWATFLAEPLEKQGFMLLAGVYCYRPYNQQNYVALWNVWKSASRDSGKGKYTGEFSAELLYPFALYGPIGFHQTRESLVLIHEGLVSRLRAAILIEQADLGRDWAKEVERIEADITKNFPFVWTWQNLLKNADLTKL